MMRKFTRTLCCSLCLLFPLTLPLALAQEQPQPQKSSAPEAAPRDLSVNEQQIFRDYERFEKSLFDVAEQMRRKDPERAQFLYRARSQSQEQNILSEMQTIAELLRIKNASGSQVEPQYGPAADRQKEVLIRMKAVLRLLQSQDERERVAAEIARIQELLKETNKIIARQKDVRADTQRSKEPGKNRDAQQRVADEAKKLSDKIDEQDKEKDQSDQPPSSPDQNSKDPSGKSKDPSGKPEKPDSGKSNPSESQDQKSDGKSSPQQSGDQKQSGQQGDQKQSGEKQSGEMPPGQQGSPKQSGEPQQGDQKPQNGQDRKEASPPTPNDSRKTPGREQLEQAREEMQQAIEKLEEQQKDQAVENQDQAVNRLEELKAQLEEILRQLREDERESYLTMLEARFQNMLKRQQHINTETIRINKIDAASRSQQNFASQADTLRKEQDDNALEAQKALHLLKEEGSSVAFPEAVQQMHQNMLLVVSRLSRQETGPTTQVVEKLIVDTLDEMIAALRQELQKQQEQKQGQQGGQGQPQDPTLVNQIAELKLIRSLQNQINVLTRQLGAEVASETDRTSDQLQLIQDLRARQERLQDATYDLSVGRNQ